MSTAKAASATEPLEFFIDGIAMRLEPGHPGVIGRGSESAFTLENAQVSRRHAEIVNINGQWMLRDLGSSNGTFFGSQRLEAPVPLMPGSRYLIGGIEGAVLTVPTPRPSGSITGKLPRRAPQPPKQRNNVGHVFDTYEATSVTSTAATSTGSQTASRLPGRSGPPAVHQRGAVTIGRGRHNDIVISDLLASRHHTRLTPNSSGYAVEDLGSRNGTYLNGSRVVRGQMGDGDLLAIGHTRFTLRDGELISNEDTGDVAFVANHLSFQLDNGKKLLEDVSFGLEGSSLVAVIGPSGAGKSTLLKALIGSQQATEGEVYYDGRDLYDNYEDLRHRIGVVPQDDVVHGQLTVRQALSYAASLRFPDDLDPELREQRVDEVIGELGLTEHVDTRVDRLSGGQRKRTSVALELLTRPSLLFLDEPTSGLDPGLDKRVMQTLRTLADDGRTVVVITHNVASLNVCDRVLLLAPGGRVAYFGPPDRILEFFNAQDYADVFNAATDNPQRAQRIFANSPLMDSHVVGPLSAPRAPAAVEEHQGHRQQTIAGQTWTLIKRQFRVMVSDSGFVRFMSALPILLGLLVLLVPGEFGFKTVHKGDTQELKDTAEALQTMILLVMGSVFMGLALTIRELVAERAIYMRERAVGLSPVAYLLSKVTAFGVVLAIQTAVLAGIAIAIQGSPSKAVLFGNPIFEVWLLCFLTALASHAMGLMLSSFAKTSEQVMPMLIIGVMCSLVFSGGLFDLDNPVIKYVSMLFPSRWGLIMGVQTTDVVGSREALNVLTNDGWWKRNPTNYAIATGALCVQFVVFFTISWFRTKRRQSV